MANSHTGHCRLIFALHHRNRVGKYTAESTEEFAYSQIVLEKDRMNNWEAEEQHRATQREVMKLFSSPFLHAQEM
jgi:hypothetical protein